jgi:hypothetical protein
MDLTIGKIKGQVVRLNAWLGPLLSLKEASKLTLSPSLHRSSLCSIATRETMRSSINLISR